MLLFGVSAPCLRVLGHPFPKTGLLRVHILTEKRFFEIRCKDKSKVNNVFLRWWKFYQKIVSFSSDCLLVVPSEAVLHADSGNALLFRYLQSCLLYGKALISGDEICVHEGLVLYFDLMPLLRHVGVIRLPYQVRYVV